MAGLDNGFDNEKGTTSSQPLAAPASRGQHDTSAMQRHRGVRLDPTRPYAHQGDGEFDDQRVGWARPESSGLVQTVPKSRDRQLR